MGFGKFIKDLFASPPGNSSEPSSSEQPAIGDLVGKTVIMKGDGSFELHVVGESHRQDALKRVVGPYTEEGRRVETLAVLMPDNSNPHDSNAVRVQLDNEHVGYLDRENAAQWRDEVFSTGILGAGCQALIAGGWKRGRDDIGMYGVRLDVCYPFVVIAISDD